MNILLDTCVFLWIVRDPKQLSANAQAFITDSSHTLYLSVISVWEIAIKNGLGRLPLAEPPHIYVPTERDKHDILSLELHEAAVLELRRLPNHHQDPFDRMLICQAIADGLSLLTPDSHIQAYPVRTLW
ncbi:MAG: type II toxin-antitoxin system VapC family toxin [Candidatus Competibacteraceae bacterium]|nr:type II toxin-antitoxin system VapC family toxin [Candidatus Competibacteraceae bacterium]